MKKPNSGRASWAFAGPGEMAGPLPGDRASRYRLIGADPPLTDCLRARNVGGVGQTSFWGSVWRG